MDYEKMDKEIIGKLQSFLNNAKKQGHIVVRIEDLENTFPELKESEGERIRKEIISALMFANVNRVYDKHISWLEKQGESKFEQHTQEGDKIVTNEDGTHFNISQLERVAKKEPKFKVRDWIIFAENHNSVYQVERIDNYRYYLRHYLGGTLSVHFDNELIRLWTIQDAKDGDVLASKDKLDILIFRKLDADAYFSSYYNITGKGELGWSSKNFIPATKEQRELLFQKMHEEGKEWDSDKKELKRISLVSAARVFLEELSKTPYNNKPITDAQIMTKELLNFLQNPASYNPDALNEQKPAWSEEDLNRFGNLIYLVECSNEGDATKEGFIKFINRLKSLKPQNRWTPSDKQMSELNAVFNGDDAGWDDGVLESLYNDLKKLREE